MNGSSDPCHGGAAGTGSSTSGAPQGAHVRLVCALLPLALVTLPALLLL